MADLHGSRSQLPLLQQHKEKHFTAGDIVRDIIIGVSDGLTVPFALAAGLSGANASSSIVLTAGIAEVAAGAISMGLGGYLAAKSEADQYKKELRREEEEIVLVPDTGLEKPEPKRAIQSALTIAISYILGGLVPLIPYMFFPKASEAVLASVALTLVALLVFGYAKGYFTGNKPFTSAVQTALIGAIASAAAYGMAKAIQPRQP
ncbi:vacuolar iron transporter 1.1-like [Cucumis melo var. makuwa]|uniref:Vacuolar iron transporter n=1 Tax=Cucumis melo var. makuwa TaxID=1194695 RepID=A0A5D3CWL4_CUCMM|nr:vacuolar iron transporter 1.1-like [Cucumis melo var. makuwa]TYK14659.1 vacuolar iron transporter 1.1-like [Cucumis melo var. makuwa]